MTAMTQGMNLLPKKQMTGPTISKNIAMTHGYFSMKMEMVSKEASGHPTAEVKLRVGLHLSVSLTTTVAASKTAVAVESHWMLKDTEDDLTS